MVSIFNCRRPCSSPLYCVCSQKSLDLLDWSRQELLLFSGIAFVFRFSPYFWILLGSVFHCALCWMIDCQGLYMGGYVYSRVSLLGVEPWITKCLLGVMMKSKYYICYRNVIFSKIHYYLFNPFRFGVFIMHAMRIVTC